jgi:ABC-2 type transport system permease protein
MSSSARASTDRTIGQSFTHAWLIARIEIRCSYRQMMDESNRIQLVGMLISGLVFLFVIFGMIAGAYVLGRAVGTDAFADLLSIARAVVAGIGVFSAFMIVITTLQEYGDLDEPTAVLTAIPYEEAALGLLLVNHISIAGLAVLPILAVAVAFAVGANSVVSIPVITVVLLALIVFSTTVGFILGQFIKLITARVAFVARYKTWIGVLAFVVYFAVLVSGPFEELFGANWTVVGATPLGWVTDLALVAVPAPSIGIARPAGGAVTLLAGTALLTWLAVRLTGTLWYTDSVQPDEADDRNTASTGATDGLIAGFSERLFAGLVSRPTLRIAQKSWRRAYRAPQKLQFAAWPVFFLIAPVQQSIEAGEISTVLPVSIAIYGAWATGAAFTLNPLGDEGAVLSITLVSGIRGTQLLRGLIFAGAAIGGPTTVVLATAIGLASPMSVFSAVVTGVLGGVLCVGACAIGVSVGTAFPKFERTRLSRNYKAVVPSMWAFAVYSLVLFVVLLPGLFASVPLLARWLGGQVGVPPQTIVIAGLAVTTLLAGMAAVIGLRTAAKKIDDYTLDR